MFDGFESLNNFLNQDVYCQGFKMSALKNQKKYLIINLLFINMFEKGFFTGTLYQNIYFF